MKIFINYLEKDYESAIRFYHELKNSGFNPWIDKYDILPGQDIDYYTKTAIDHSSRIFTILLSNNSDLSGRKKFNRNLNWAIDKAQEFTGDEIFIIPIRLEDCQMPEQIKHLHPVDFFRKWEDGFDKLKKSLVETYKGISGYLGRIDRARFIVETIENLIPKSIKNNKIEIRLRATFASWSNIEHYHNKDIPGLLDDQRKELDRLLVSEKEGRIRKKGHPSLFS